MMAEDQKTQLQKTALDSNYIRRQLFNFAAILYHITIILLQSVHIIALIFYLFNFTINNKNLFFYFIIFLNYLTII